MEGNKNLVGALYGGNSLRGGVATVFGKDGKSAYEVAVANGFNGTETEWLETLHGEKGNPGVYLGGGDMPDDCNVQIDPNGEPIDLEKEIENAVRSYILRNTARVGSVTLLASAWVGNSSPYSQVVAVDSVTENSQVDLTPSIEQLAVFHNKDLAFVTENVDGVVTVYAIGEKPLNDYTIQVTITEVYV